MRHGIWCSIRIGFDRDIDSDDAFSRRPDDDGVEIKCAKPAGIRNSELAETDEQFCQRVDIAMFAAARAGKQRGGLDAMNHLHGIVVR